MTSSIFMVGIIAFLVSLGFHLRPLSKFMDIIMTRKSVGKQKLSVFPFFLILFHCIMWTIYSIIIDPSGNYFLLIINGTIGVAFELMYVIFLFICVEDQTRKISILCGAAEAMLVVVIILVINFVQGQARLIYVRVFADISSMVFFAIPFVDMIKVVNNYSMKWWMSFWLYLAINFAYALIWAIYGYLRLDDNIFICNSVGAGATVFLFIWGCYVLYNQNGEDIIPEVIPGEALELI